MAGSAGRRRRRLLLLLVLVLRLLRHWRRHCLKRQVLLHCRLADAMRGACHALEEEVGDRWVPQTEQLLSSNRKGFGRARWRTRWQL